MLPTIEICRDGMIGALQFKSLESKLADVDAEINVLAATEVTDMESIARLELRKQEIQRNIEGLSFEDPNVLSKMDDDARSTSDSECTDESLLSTSMTSQGLSALLHAADGLSEYQSYVDKAAAEERARYEAYKVKKEQEQRPASASCAIASTEVRNSFALESQRSASFSHPSTGEGKGKGKAPVAEHGSSLPISTLCPRY